MSFSFYLHKDFIKVPFPITGLHAPCSSLFNFACELRAKPVPPVADRFIAYVHASFMQKIFYISQWEWKSHIQHHRKLDDLWTGFKIAERYRIGHVTEVNFQDAVGQGGLFWQSLHASFMQQVFYISKRERKSHIQHHCKLDDLRAGFEIAKGYRIGHS